MKLRCENLVKKYGVRTVVKGVSMEVEHVRKTVLVHIQKHNGIVLGTKINGICLR